MAGHGFSAFAFYAFQHAEYNSVCVRVCVRVMLVTAMSCDHEVVR